MNNIYTSDDGARVLAQQYTAFLEQWPVPAFVMASGPKDAAPLVLLHGSGANAAMWADDVALWARHFRIYTIDVIGEPGLSAPSRPALGSDAYALWLDDVLDALNVGSAAFMGTSLGGWLALDHAVRRPKRVDRLALRCPSGIGGQKMGLLVASLFLQPFGDRGRRTMLNLALGPTPATATATVQERAFGEYVMLIHKYFRPRRQKLPVFTDGDLEVLNMPVQVTVGGRDRLMDSHDTRRRFQQTTPHASVTFLPETGHLLKNQAQPVLDFLLTTERKKTPCPTRSRRSPARPSSSARRTAHRCATSTT
ncbi:alpha/beta fold hydrolase [Streptomyces avermitilis]|uniref:alpha/beta fold hydrolase n=1 Tax=Streptomyces avermitilis TaxID=33903 RepID=UPI00380BA074